MKIIAVLPYSGEDAFLEAHQHVIDGRLIQLSTTQQMFELGKLVAQSDETGNPLLVYSSETTLNALEDRGLSYYLVYPSAECKGEYVKRALDGTVNPSITRLYDAAWDDLLDDLHRRRKAYPLILGQCMLMNDILTVNGADIILKD